MLSCIRCESSADSGTHNDIERDSQKSENCQIPLGRILFFIGLLCSTTSFILSVWVICRIHDFEQLENGESERLASHRHGLCVPCSHLSQGPFPEENSKLEMFAQMPEGSLIVCCAESANDTSLLLDLFLRRKMKEYRAKGIFPANATNINSSHAQHNTIDVASAHVFIDTSGDRFYGRRGPIPGWSLKDPRAHVSGGIRMEKHGRLVVLERGLYFLYSQVRFDMYSVRPDNLPHRSIHHYIMRYNVKYPNDGIQILLKTSSTLCWAERKDYEDHVSYLGAGFELEAYDELYVEVSNLTLVSRDSIASFFGLFKIS